MRLLRRVLFILPCICVAVSPSYFGALQWRLIGPFRGGRSVAVSGVAGSGSKFYFGSVNGGVWKTTDAGMVWRPAFDSQPVASIGALEVAPSDENVVYAGTGESDIRSALSSGNGVYKSDDAGNTWRNIGLKDTRQISRIAVDPRNANVVFVAALGHAYAPNEERGIFRSSDGGATWQKVLYKDARTGAADIALAPDDPNTIFAAMWEAYRPPWSTYAPIEGPGSGLYRSQDGGNTWSEIKGNGFPSAPLGRIGVAVARGTKGRRIYALVEAQAEKAGLYRTDDGGNSWTRVNSDPRISGRGWYFSSITADPNNPDVVYIPNVCLYKLSDGGKTLSIVRGAPGGDDYHQLWIDSADSNRMALATDQGTTITLNGGETWSSWYNQPTAQFYHLAVDNQFPYHVYGAQQDSSTAAIASRSDYGQIDARDRFSFGGSESGWVALDPRDPNIIYVSGVFGTVERFDRRTGQSHNISPSPLPAFGSSIADQKYRAPWTPMLVFSSLERGALYLGTQYVMKTLDGGLHWQTISPDLTGKDENASKNAKVSVDNAKELGYGTVYSIAPSPLQSAEIWAGSDTGLIHVTRDGGRHWQNVTPPEISPWSKITHIEPSHFNIGEAFAAVDRHRLDDRRPYLYRTRDFGKHWTLAVYGIEDPAFFNCIREDPKRQGLLYAGTEFGVYVSFDDGDHWQSLQLNLPVTSVRDLAVHENDLVVATHGRSFWVLDNISPLRQFSAKDDSDETRLFTPAAAYRVTNDAFSGTPLPPEEPQAKNPPNGAMIDYYLAAGAREVTLTILDQQGKAVRRFSSKDPAAPPPANLPIAGRWLQTPPSLSSAVGMHRWIWDLRYGRGADLNSAGDDDDNSSAPGPRVLPGVYRVKIDVDGRTFTQSLTIRMDPRSAATPADLQEQFVWASRAYTDIVQADKAIAHLKSQKYSGDLLNGKESLPALARTLNVLLSGMESADRRPTAQLIAAYRATTTTLYRRLAAARMPEAK